MALTLNPFRKVRELVTLANTAGPSPAHAGPAAIASPWTTAQLNTVVWADVFGTDVDVPVTREEAMRVPAVTKGRGLVAGTLARQPLAAYRGADKLEGTAAPTWLYRTNNGQSPYQRMLWTIDDLIFRGMSLWTVDRNAAGQVVGALRVPSEWWTIDADLQIIVEGIPAADGSVVLIEGPQDGLVDIAAADIRAARSMGQAWSGRVKSPVPLVELHQTTDDQLDEADVKQTVADWEAARSSGNATGYTPYNVEVRVHGDSSTDLFVEGRNASRLDMANYLQVPASLLEGSTATASLTYSTQEGQRNELVDYSLSYWAAPIEARLSMDDVVPSGMRVAFDLSYFTSPAQPAGPTPTED